MKINAFQQESLLASDFSSKSTYSITGWSKLLNGQLTSSILLNKNPTKKKITIKKEETDDQTKPQEEPMKFSNKFHKKGKIRDERVWERDWPCRWAEPRSGNGFPSASWPWASSRRRGMRNPSERRREEKRFVLEIRTPRDDENARSAGDEASVVLGLFINTPARAKPVISEWFF